MRFSRNAADERRLVDEIAARQVDEERMRLHSRQRRLPDQVFGLLVGDGETDDKVGTAKQIVERHMLDAGVADGRKGIGDQNLHAQHLGDISQVTADAAIADDAEAAAGQLPAHDDLRLALRHGSRRVARETPRDRSTMKPSASSATDWTKPGPARVTRTPAAEAASTSMLRISTAQRTKARKFRQRRKYLARSRGEPVGDDDIDIARGLDQAGGIERIVRFMQLYLRDGLQPLQAALAIILGPGLRRMGQQDFQRWTASLSIAKACGIAAGTSMAKRKPHARQRGRLRLFRSRDRRAVPLFAGGIFELLPAALDHRPMTRHRHSGFPAPSRTQRSRR